MRRHKRSSGVARFDRLVRHWSCRRHHLFRRLRGRAIRRRSSYRLAREARARAHAHHMAAPIMTDGLGPAAQRTAECRHFRRGYCSFGDACKFLHIAAPAPATPATDAAKRGRQYGKRKNLGRVVIFRRWLVETFGAEALALGSGVIDVAGGRGALSFELLNVHNIPSTVVDPCPSLRLSRIIRQWERGTYHAQRSARASVVGGSEASSAAQPPTAAALDSPARLPSHWPVYWREALWQSAVLASSVTGEEDNGGGSAAPDEPSAALPLPSSTAAALAAVEAALHWAPRSGGAGGDGVHRLARDVCGCDDDDAMSESDDGNGAGDGASNADDRPPSRPPSAAEASAVLSGCAAIVGMHPDAATEAIVDYALATNKSFAIVPCCVFATAFPRRRHVTSHAAFVEYLAAKDPRVRVATLPFGGRNRVVYALPAAARSEQEEEHQEQVLDRHPEVEQLEPKHPQPSACRDDRGSAPNALAEECVACE